MAETQRFLDDLQASVPDVRIGLSRAGVTGVEKAIRLRQKLIPARIDCTVDLPPSQKGVHMSRFPELFEEAIEEVVTESFLVEELAERCGRLTAVPTYGFERDWIERERPAVVVQQFAERVLQGLTPK